LIALQQARQVPLTMQPDCDTWHALGGDNAGDLLTTYTIAPADVEGPFEERIPPNLVEQAKLPALGYRSPLERLAERFHASPALLQQLNRGVTLAAGHEIKVPAVTPFDPDAKPAVPAADAGDVAIQVSREESALRVTRADGSPLFFAPVTTGSQHDPLPPGNWTAVAGFFAGVIVTWLLMTYGPPQPSISVDRNDEPTAIPAGDGHETVPNKSTADERSPEGSRTPSGPKSTATTGVIAAMPLRVPIDGANVDAFKGGFAERRDGRAHEAIDMLAPRNTPVHAVADGTIAKLFYSKGGGGITLYQFDPTASL